MDESDERLVEALKEQIAQGRYEVGMDGGAGAGQADGGGTDAADGPVGAAGPVRHTSFAGSAAGAKDAAPSPLPTDDAVDGDFNRAMNAYRAARAAGDAQAMAQAQAQMQEVVRREMAAAEQPCQDEGKGRA